MKEETLPNPHCTVCGAATAEFDLHVKLHRLPVKVCGSECGRTAAVLVVLDGILDMLDRRLG
jgi:hypothetical protein